MKGISWDEDDDPYAYHLHIPKGFNFPMLFMYMWSNQDNNKIKWVSVPYGIGVLPEHVTSPNGKVYMFDNYYAFNMEGKAMKYEIIFLETMSESVLRGKVPQISFFPQESDSRWAELNNFDYDLIGGKLQLIKAERYIRAETIRTDIIDIHRASFFRR